jgi:outer membrane protein OmpA-like peptidoglycan-associated protein
MVLKNIFFEQGLSVVLPTSFPELDRVVTHLLENPKMEILLEGHTDNQGDFDANLQLSKERVEAVKTYFLGKGITTSRISVKGWGATRPIQNNQNPETRKLNRRVEFTVLKN